MTNPNAKYGRLARGVRRDLSEKGWVPMRYWLIWWSSIAVAIAAFYVVLTPLWMGLRAIAWLTDRRKNGRKRLRRRVEAEHLTPERRHVDPVETVDPK